jgi:hypothetical protein
MLTAVQTTLNTLLAQKGVAIVNAEGEVAVHITASSSPVFITDGADFQRTMRQEFPGRQDEWQALTPSYRNVVVKLLGKE